MGREHCTCCRSGAAGWAQCGSRLLGTLELLPLDSLRSMQASSDFDTFNLDDVDAAFALVQPLRYQQNLALRCGGVPAECPVLFAGLRGFA